MTSKKEKPTDPRALKIWELEQEGKSKGEIAKALDVDESTVYRIKRRPDYIDILRENRDEYLLGLQRMRESESENTRNEAVKEMGRMERSGAGLVAKYQLAQMQGGELTPEQQWAKDIETQKQAEYVYNEILQILPWQWKRLDNYYLDRPYEHIDKDWTPPRTIGDDWKKNKNTP